MALSEQERAEYKAAYQRWAQALRMATVAELEVRACYIRLIADRDVPAGHAFDMWGDGEVKLRDLVTPAPEVL